MMKKTHLAIGVAATVQIIVKEPIGAIGVLGAVAPDWDIILGLKHRTVTHSILALISSSVIISMLNTDIGVVWFINYLSHLLADSLTKMGVPFLYPMKKRYGLKLFKTGSGADYLIQLLAIAFICFRFLE
jgi:inner membrane protein